MMQTEATSLYKYSTGSQNINIVKNISLLKKLRSTWPEIALQCLAIPSAHHQVSKLSVAVCPWAREDNVSRSL